MNPHKLVNAAKQGLRAIPCTIMFSAMMGMAIPALADEETPPPPPSVSGVTMTQANDRKVTIEYTLADGPAVITLDVQTNATPNAAADDPGWTSIGGEAVWNAAGDVWKKVEGDTTHTITWRPDQSWPGHKITGNGARAVVTAWATNNTPQYMVVDLDVANSCRFYPGKDYLPKSSFAQEGAAITNNANFKTRQLLMRKIEAAGITWPMGADPSVETLRCSTREAAHNVQLADNYYIGVFEVTQSQWTMVTNTQAITTTSKSKPYAFTILGSVLPAHFVQWQQIRAAHPTNAPASGTFLSAIRARTGIAFDLPAESQWEFAARAGHYSGYWGDGSPMLAPHNTDDSATDSNLGRIAWYKRNSSTTLHEVGLKAPNGFDLYDTSGNVEEWCLDQGPEDADISSYGGAVYAPAAYQLSTGYTYVKKGGGYSTRVQLCRPGSGQFKQIVNGGETAVGFRLACPVGIR